MILIGDIKIDASLSESHNYSAQVTDHPVERGASITDHVRTNPLEVSVEGVVSDSPIGAIKAARESDGGTPSRETLAKLQALFFTRAPVSITTALQTYINMVLTSLSIPVDSTTGAALRFSATFRQIQYVTNSRVQIRTNVPRTKKKNDLGVQATVESTVAPQEFILVKASNEGKRVGRGIRKYVFRAGD